VKAPLLIAGIGNIFFGDDAFGCEVAQELARRPIPDGVEVCDYGIRGYDLAYALMDGRDAILLDTVSRGGEPGTLYLIEPSFDDLGDEDAPPDGHSLDPVSVLRMIRSFGGRPGRLFLVGCEPSQLESEDGEMGLSEKVQAAVPQAIDMVESVIDQYFPDISLRPGATGAVKEVS
jgi:hydrogenase maturation protease